MLDGSNCGCSHLHFTGFYGILRYAKLPYRVISRNIWRSIWERISDICINWIAITLHLPARRHRNIIPGRHIITFLEEIKGCFAQVFNELEFPCTVKRLDSRNLPIASKSILRRCIGI